MDRKHLQVPSEIVTNQDLEIGFSLARRFDLVVDQPKRLDIVIGGNTVPGRASSCQ